MNRPDENMGQYFHELSKDISQGGRVKIPADSTLWPKSWRKIEYKTYANSTKIKLLGKDESKAAVKIISLTDVLEKRKSGDFENKDKSIEPISFSQLSFIINNSVGLIKVNENRRMYPSGGARYSLEFYFLVQNCSDLKPGFYHYNLLENSLELLEAINPEKCS